MSAALAGGELGRNPTCDETREVGRSLDMASCASLLSSVLKLAKQSVDVIGVCLRAKTGRSQLSILSLGLIESEPVDGVNELIWRDVKSRKKVAFHGLVA